MTDPLSGTTLLARLQELAQLSEEPDRLVRRFLTPSHLAANTLVGRWMAEAGMQVRVDAIGNIVGRYEAAVPGAPCVMLGSHLDTVVDAGPYDGMLGVVAAIACVDHLYRQGRRLPFAIEVIGFGDEEGVRFGATLISSRAVAGTFDPSWLQRPDSEGTTLAGALQAAGLAPDQVAAASRRRGEILAYLELHIEQGPVLESLELPAGCVSAISGASRYQFTLTGMAGHAGTVPMANRQDALAGAAECILAVERYCTDHDQLVGTVGRCEVSPAAVNVIPGSASFSLDIRSPRDDTRLAAVEALLSCFEQIASRRRLTLRYNILHEARATPCAPRLMDQIDQALVSFQIKPHRLASGAGHDGMAMAVITDIGMIFIRCEHGISHHPAESITESDAETGAQVLLRTVLSLAEWTR